MVDVGTVSRGSVAAEEAVGATAGVEGPVVAVGPVVVDEHPVSMATSATKPAITEPARRGTFGAALLNMF
jgi:hypothetical protein